MLVDVEEVLSNTSRYANKYIKVTGTLVYDWQTEQLFLQESHPLSKDSILNIEIDSILNNQNFPKTDKQKYEAFLQLFSRRSRFFAKLLFKLAKLKIPFALELLHKLGKEEALANLYDAPQFVDNFAKDSLRRDPLASFGEFHFSQIHFHNSKISGSLKLSDSGIVCLHLQQLVIHKGQFFTSVQLGQSSLVQAELGFLPTLSVRDVLKNIDRYIGETVRIDGFLSGIPLYKGGERIRLVPNRFYRQISNVPIPNRRATPKHEPPEPKTNLKIDSNDLRPFRGIIMPSFTRTHTIAERVHIVGVPNIRHGDIWLTNISKLANLTYGVSWVVLD